MTCNKKEINPSYIYLSLVQEDDGVITLADQDGRKVRGVMRIATDLSIGDVANCDATICLFRPGTAEQYINKPSA